MIFLLNFGIIIISKNVFVCSYIESSKILTFQCEYDGPRDIPEGISMADYVLDAIRAYGNDEACVKSSFNS